MSRSEDPVSEQALKKLSGEFDLESIIHIDLSNKALSSLGCLPDCTQLRVLCLSHNNLRSVHGLTTLTVLETLDLSSNQIAKLDGLEKLECLYKLNLAGNMIANVESLAPLTSLPRLTHLTLTLHQFTNPVCSSSSYELFMRQSLPNLLWIDGVITRGQGSTFYTRYHHIIEQCGRTDEEEFKQHKQMYNEELFTPLPSNSGNEKETEILDGMLLECSGRSQDISRQIGVLRTSLNNSES